MGLLGDLAQLVPARLSGQPVYLQVAIGLGAFVFVACFLNVARQLLWKNKNEPPLVFHWVPFFGSTVTYGIDPYKFFFRCREQVRAPTTLKRDSSGDWKRNDGLTVYSSSTGMSSPSSSWARKPPSFSEQRAMISS